MRVSYFGGQLGQATQAASLANALTPTLSDHLAQRPVFHSCHNMPQSFAKIRLVLGLLGDDHFCES